MNKNHSKRETNNHITRIQANLNDMKNQISEYLKKQTNDKTPPILKARHYLLLSYMKDYHTFSHNQSIENTKIKKELSSEKLGCNLQNESFEPMRSQIFNENHQKNKIVKQKRPIVSKNLSSSVQEEVSQLLPTICNLNLQCSQSFHISLNKNINSRTNLLQRRLNETINTSPLFDKPKNSTRYHSIDINEHSHLISQAALNSTRMFRMGSKSITIGFPRKHLTNQLSKIKFNTKVQDYLKNSSVDISNDQNQGEIAKKLDINNLQKEELKMEPNLHFLNEEKHFLKKRFYLRQKSIPPISNLFTSRNNLKKDITKSRKDLFTKQPISYSPVVIKSNKKKQKNQFYSPWQEDMQKQKALYFLQNDFL